MSLLYVSSIKFSVNRFVKKIYPFTPILVHRITLEPSPLSKSKKFAQHFNEQYLHIKTIGESMHVSVCQNIAYVTRVNKVEKSNFSYGTVRTHIYKQSHANQGTCRSHSKPIHSNSYKQVGTRGKRGQIGRRCACFSLTWWGRAMRITDPKSLVFNMCTAFT